MRKAQTRFMLSFFLTAAIILSGLWGNSISFAETLEESSQENTIMTAKATATPTATAKATATPTATQKATVTPTPASTTTNVPVTPTPSSTATQAPSGTSSPTVSPATSTAATGKNPFTGSTYTHSESQAGKNIFLGIDVSYHNGDINWTKVKASGVQFVVLRLGYRGYGTAGTLNLDKKFRTYAQGAIAAGLPTGIYFYTEAISEAEARAEAEFCIENVKDFKITLPIAYDFEPSTNKGRLYKANLSKSKATAMCRAFCTTIKEAGYTPMIYANKSDLSSKIDGASLGNEYKIWVAQYNSKTTYSSEYEFWQYSSSGKVDGISGTVDCNFWYTINTTPDATNSIKISSADVASISKKVYSGKEKKPAVTITYQEKTLTEGEDYLLTYENNINIGKATVTITGINDFTGSKTTTFNIVPKTITNFVQKETTAKKTIVLNWSKCASATGYRLYRKATLNGTTYKKAAEFTTNKTTSFTDTKRAAHRTFYYAIRAYTIVNGTRYYGKYTYLTAATNPTVNTQKLKKATNLYEVEDVKNAENKILLKIPKNAEIIHLGKVYLTSSEYVYHVAYCVGETTHEGYIASSTEFK